MQRRAVVVALVLAWALLFGPQLFAGRVFVLGDATTFRPFAEFSKARWQQVHERTDWNPYVFLGLPARASLADSRPQWLPDPLLSAYDAVRDAPFLPPLWPLLGAQLAGWLAMASLARRVWKCGPVPMVTCALVWGASPAVLTPLAFGHDAQVWTWSLLPVALLAVHAIVAAPESRGARLSALGLAATLAVQMLAGHPQFVAYTGVLVVAFALERAFTRSRPARLLLVAAAIAAGAAASAAVWLPAMLYARESVRSLPNFAARELADFSAGLRDLWAIVWPRAAGFGGETYWGGLKKTDFPYYAGVLATGLAMAGLFTRRRDGARLIAVVLGAVVVLAVLGSLGAHLPPLASLLAVLPFGSSFRTPVTLLAPALFALALLSARGGETLLLAMREGRWRRPAIAAGVAAAALAFVLVAGGGLQRGHTEAMTMSKARAMSGMEAMGALSVDDDWAKSAEREGPRAFGDLAARLALLVLAAGSAALVARAAPSRAGAAAVAFGALVALDVALIGAPVLGRASGARAALDPAAPPPLARAAAADPRHRAYPFDRALSGSNAWITWRARNVFGVHGAVPRVFDELREAGLLGREGFVRGLSVRHVGGESFQLDDSSHWERLGGGVLARRDALPRARAVARVVGVAGAPSVQAALADPRFDPSEQAFTEDGSAAGDYPGSPGTRIAWRRDDPDRLEWTIDAPGRAFVVVADTWASGWTATVDGRSVPVHRVDHALRGVRLDAGRHEVTMRYVTPGAAMGAWLSLAAWAGMALAAVLLALPRRTPASS